MPTDSILYDSPAPADTLLRPFDAPALDSAYVSGLCPVAEASSVVAEQAPEPPAWLSGIDGTPRPSHPGHDSALLALLGVTAVALMMCSRGLFRTLSALVGELWSVRQRANIFDEHVSGHGPSVAVLLMLYVICTGLIMYAALDYSGVVSQPYSFGRLACLFGLSGGYYLFQLVAYAVVGYTFTTAELRAQWLRGFNASAGLLGLLLIVPALVAIFYPGCSGIAVWVALGLYFAARVVFVAKGVRIFYDKIQSIVFFILYLCTLEIIPPLFIYFWATVLVNYSS